MATSPRRAHELAMIWMSDDRVAAHGAEGAVGDAVAGDEHAAGAENVDAVAVLAGAAAVGPDAHDAVGGDDAAVLAGLGAPHLDAVVAAVGDVVVGNLQPRRVDAADGGLDDRVDGAVGDAAGTGDERDAVGGAARHRQAVQTHAAAIAEGDEALGAAVIERLVGAVEHETFEQDPVGLVGGDEGAAAGELQRRGAGGADEAGARAQLQRADAVAPGGQLERRTAAGGGVERGLQHRSLIDGAARDEVQRRIGLRARPRFGRTCAGGGGTGSQAGGEAGGKHVAAVERHRWEPRWSMLSEKQV